MKQYNRQALYLPQPTKLPENFSGSFNFGQIGGESLEKNKN